MQKLVVAVSVLILSSLATAQGFTFITIEASDSGCCTYAYGMNNLGQVVGYYFVSGTDRSHQFVYTDGAFTIIDVSPIGTGQSTYGINDTGQFVGSYEGSGFPTTGFLYSGDILTSFTVPFPRAAYTWAYGINNDGEIVGSYAVPGSGGGGHGFLRDPNGGFTSIDVNVSGSFGTTALGINDLGQIVGLYRDAANHYHGFIYDGSIFTTLDVPFSGTHTGIWGINNLGQVVGTYWNDSNPITHGFFGDTDGSVAPIDVPVAQRTSATGINDSGQITGYYLDGRTGLTHGFLASPSDAKSIMRIR